MNGKSRRNRNRLTENKITKLLILLCILMTIVVAALWNRACSLERESSGTAIESNQEHRNSVSDEHLENELENPSETTGEKADESLEQMKEIEKTNDEVETETQYLKNLSGLAAGTILDPQQIDFNNPEQYFMSWEIEEGDNLFKRINGKSYRTNDDVPLNTLRYLKMPHYNFKGQIQVGEMIVNQDIEHDILKIFKELFAAKYEIQSMYLVDHYWTGDPDTTDSASIEENNTSAFCYRQVTGGGKLSNHAYGRAIDINPQQNPYVSYSSGSPKWSHANANDYIARETGMSHVITHDDLAYQLFFRYGFRWGGDWKNPKDYQHFEKNKS